MLIKIPLFVFHKMKYYQLLDRKTPTKPLEDVVVFHHFLDIQPKMIV